jgi:hypothetical protein
MSLTDEELAKIPADKAISRFYGQPDDMAKWVMAAPIHEIHKARSKTTLRSHEVIRETLLLRLTEEAMAAAGISHRSMIRLTWWIAILTAITAFAAFYQLLKHC